MGLGEGYVMQHVDGETLGRRIVDDARLAGARAVLARQCGQALARIHAHRHAATAAVAPRAGAPRSWPTTRRGTAAMAARKPVFELALQWLQGRMPA